MEVMEALGLERIVVCVLTNQGLRMSISRTSKLLALVTKPLITPTRIIVQDMFPIMVMNSVLEANLTAPITPLVCQVEVDICREAVRLMNLIQSISTTFLFNNLFNKSPLMAISTSKLHIIVA